MALEYPLLGSEPWLYFFSATEVEAPFASPNLQFSEGKMEIMRLCKALAL